MFKLITNGLTVEGDLHSFDPGSNTTYLHFKNKITVEIPNPPPQLIRVMSAVGLTKLRNATIDLTNLTNPMIRVETETATGETKATEVVEKVIEDTVQTRDYLEASVTTPLRG